MTWQAVPWAVVVLLVGVPLGVLLGSLGWQAVLPVARPRQPLHRAGLGDRGRRARRAAPPRRTRPGGRPARRPPPPPPSHCGRSDVGTVQAMGLYRAEGIVLRTYKLGEADRIVSVLTPPPREGASGGEGSPQDQEPLRGPARAADPPPAPAVRGASELNIVGQPRPSTTSGRSATTSTGSPGRRRCWRPSTSSGTRGSRTPGCSRCSWGAACAGGSQRSARPCPGSSQGPCPGGVPAVTDGCVVCDLADVAWLRSTWTAGARASTGARTAISGAALGSRRILGGRLGGAERAGLPGHPGGRAPRSAIDGAPPRARSALGDDLLTTQRPTPPHTKPSDLSRDPSVWDTVGCTGR